jgi:hypothetical protein
MQRLLAAIFWLVPVAALAQPASTAPQQRAAIERIAWMAGVWEGTSTFDRGREGVSETLSWERVRSAAGGTALLVEGRHDKRLPDGSRGARTHDTAGLITFDPQTGKYRFTAQLADGTHGSHEGEMQGDVFVWRTETPYGTARFRISLEKDRWTERGEFCPKSDRQDPPCRPFFSMSLGRVADARD